MAKKRIKETEPKPENDKTILTRSLACKLNDKERIEYGLQNAMDSEKIESMQDDLAAQSKVVKSEIKMLKRNIRVRERELVAQETHREIEVEVKKDFATNKIYEVRLDTNEQINSRKMTAEERQMKIEIVNFDDTETLGNA